MYVYSRASLALLSSDILSGSGTQYAFSSYIKLPLHERRVWPVHSSNDAFMKSSLKPLAQNEVWKGKVFLLFIELTLVIQLLGTRGGSSV